ncbi:MAG: type 4a pilus biogenesis protein PilO [candidate division Zixibacteria bacterium]|nr:type 4a pilus biogenesis protein PilO [candidate division Zixibacteria bacterium]
MDFKEPKTQKIMIGVIALFIVGYFWYTRLYVNYDAQIAQKSAEFETITTNLRNVEIKAKSLDALQVEYTELIDRYHEIEALLPEVKQIPSLLVQLHTASSLTGTRITNITPRPIGTEDFYNIASFDLEMTGTYHDFGKFVSYMANFPFIANLSDMQLTSQKLVISEESEDDGSNTKKETMTARFVLSTYFVKEGARLSELAL